MLKLWFNFLRLDQLKDNQCLTHFFIFLFFLFNAGLLSAAPQVLPSSRPSPFLSNSVSSQKLLNIPIEFQNYDHSEIKVGDRLFFKVPNIAPTPSVTGQFKVEKSESFIVEDWFVDDAKLTEGQIVLTPLKSGQLVLPSFILKSDSGETLGQTETQTIQVQSAISKDDKRPDESGGILPPLGLDYPIWLVIILSFILGGLFLGICYLAYCFWKKRKKRIVETILPVLPEEEIALNELLDLEKQKYVDQGELKKYYFRISEIIKKYIGSRYEFDALESTSFELISSLKSHHNIPSSLTEQLENLFSRIDLVKFTDYIPEKIDSYHLIPEVKEWVEKTKKDRTSSAVSKNDSIKDEVNHEIR